MTGAVDVIVDRHDDLATVRTVHRLAAENPGVLAVSIAPDWRADPAVIWAILRALGKRSECLAERPPLDWMDAERWLIAHHISELIVLRAQHLKASSQHGLARLAERASLRVTLVHSGETQRRATRTITKLIARPPQAAPTRCRQLGWPSVPRSHPLRLRYDCSQQLAPQEFRRVDKLLYAAFGTLNGWLRAHRHATVDQLDQAISLISAAHDPAQGYIRRSGVAIALICARITSPPARPLPLRSHIPSTAQIDAALAHTDRPAAGYRLAELVTGLPADLLELVGGDQITDHAILGLAVPEPARPVLRALDQYCEPVLKRPRTNPAQPAQSSGPTGRPTPARNLDSDPLVSELGWLLRGRRETLRAAEVTPAVRVELEKLRADEILDLENGAYRASHIALYGSYELPLPPIRSTDIQAGRSTDINRESR